MQYAGAQKNLCRMYIIDASLLSVAAKFPRASQTFSVWCSVICKPVPATKHWMQHITESLLQVCDIWLYWPPPEWLQKQCYFCLSEAFRLMPIIRNEIKFHGTNVNINCKLHTKPIYTNGKENIRLFHHSNNLIAFAMF